MSDLIKDYSVYKSVYADFMTSEYEEVSAIAFMEALQKHVEGLMEEHDLVRFEEAHDDSLSFLCFDKLTEEELAKRNSNKFARLEAELKRVTRQKETIENQMKELQEGKNE